MSPSFLNIDDFCDNSIQELNRTDPRAIMSNTENMLKINAALKNASDPHFY